MLIWLRIGAVLMLLSRAYEHIRWGGPYRDIFFHPDGFGGWYSQWIDRPLVEIFKDPFYENALLYFSDGIGVIFLLTAVIIIFYERLSNFKWIFYVASFFLLLNYFGLLYGKNLDQYGMFFEHMAQFIIIWLFDWCYQKKYDNLKWGSAIAIAVTFTAHGLYAMGYYPQPGHFADMMITGFGLTEDTARLLLVWIGYLDFVFAGLVLITPFAVHKFPKGIFFRLLEFNIWYGIIWGCLTAFARIYTTYLEGQEGYWIGQHLWKVTVRLPHFIIPVVIWLLLFRNRKV